MGLFAQIDAELQKDLLDFVKAQEKDKGPHTLGDRLIVEVLKSLISGDARMSGCVTNHGNKRMYLEISFFEEENGDAPKGTAD